MAGLEEPLPHLDRPGRGLGVAFARHVRPAISIDHVQTNGVKQIRFRGSFWLFCIAMIFLYYRGLSHPVESGYWLARFGFAILILEFFSVFVVIALLEITDKASYRRASGVPIFVIVIVTLLAFAFCWLADIWSFVYFLVAIPMKFIAFRRLETTAESRERFRSAIVTGSAIVSSALVAALLTKKYESAFHAQAQLLGQYLVDSNSPLAVQTTQGFLVFIGFWGVLHFLLSILFDVGVKMNGSGGTLPQRVRRGS
jgi:hypothetical protein